MSDWFLADDLSGALDAGAAFRAAGRRVRLVEAADDWRPGPEGELVGVNTESRNLPPGIALAAGAAQLRSAGAALVLAPEARARPERIRDSIAALGAALIGDHGVRRVFVTGGETARALAARLGLRKLFVAGTIEPGLVLATATSPATGPLLLAVKPGGFGDADTWVRAAAALGGPGRA